MRVYIARIRVLSFTLQHGDSLYTCEFAPHLYMRSTHTNKAHVTTHIHLIYVSLTHSHSLLPFNSLSFSSRLFLSLFLSPPSISLSHTRIHTLSLTPSLALSRLFFCLWLCLSFFSLVLVLPVLPITTHNYTPHLPLPTHNYTLYLTLDPHNHKPHLTPGAHNYTLVLPVLLMNTHNYTGYLSPNTHDYTPCVTLHTHNYTLCLSLNTHKYTANLPLHTHN